MKDTTITITSKQKYMLIVCLFSIAVLLLLTASSCDTDTSNTGTQYTAPKADAYCDESASVTCKMINERYDFLKDPDRVGYFYGFQGQSASPIIEYVVRGMVVDVNNSTTPPDYQEGCISGGAQCSVVRQAKQPDQTWGENGYNTVFGFRADGSYFEFKGNYEFDSTPNPQLHPLSVLGCASFTATGGNGSKMRKGQVIRPDC